MIEELHVAAQSLPPGWKLKVKEHPSAKVSFTAQLKHLQNEKFLIANHLNTFDLVSESQGVVTLNSSVGLQAMLYDKPVLVLGEAFYGFEPITHRANNAKELNRWFTLAENWAYDSEARSAFINYLLQEYYLEASLSQAPFLGSRGQQLIQRLLSD